MNTMKMKIKKYKSMMEFEKAFLPKSYDENIIKEHEIKSNKSGTGLAIELIKTIKTKLTTRLDHI